MEQQLPRIGSIRKAPIRSRSRLNRSSSASASLSGTTPTRSRCALGMPLPNGTTSGASPDAGSQDLHLRAPQHRIEHAVERALDHHEAVAAGIAARHAQRRRHRLGAGIGEAHLLDRRHHLDHQLGDRRFQLGRERRHAADLDPAARRAVDALVAVAEDDRAPAQAEIDIAVAVEIPQQRALAALHVDRRVIAPIAIGVGNAERQRFRRALMLPLRCVQHALAARAVVEIQLRCGRHDIPRRNAT